MGSGKQHASENHGQCVPRLVFSTTGSPKVSGQSPPVFLSPLDEQQIADFDSVGRLVKVSSWTTSLLSLWKRHEVEQIPCTQIVQS